MSLRTKLTIGLGFLFLIIFALTIYSSYNIQNLAKDADRILKDNYDTLVYCKNMLIAIDDMRSAITSRILNPGMKEQSVYGMQLFENSKATFERNLIAEKNNLTELHEADYVGELDGSYDIYLRSCLKIEKVGGTATGYVNDFMPTYLNTRQGIIKINDLNMQAIERKNQSTKNDAKSMMISTAAVGAICVILAFFYFWYFPFYISNTISYLAKKMNAFLSSIGLNVDMRTKDETFILLQSINLLETKYQKQGKSKTR